MSDDFATYTPDLVVATFKGVTIDGYAEGTFIEVERDEDAFTHKAGSLGDVVRTHNLNKMGKVTITVLAQHPINDLLMAIHNSDDANGDGIGAFQVKDLSGGTRCDAAVGWIPKPPKMDRAKESGNVVWTIHLAKLNVLIAGNVNIVIA